MKTVTMITALLLSTLVAPALAAEVKVQVNNLTANKGKLYASLCTSEKFMVARCDFEIVLAVKQDKAQLVFNNLDAGQYAVSIFYDVNSNGKLDSSLFGIPEEPTGVSNNAVGKNGPPKFSDASFVLSAEQEHQLTIDLY
jgi:uncharacterized protein (DUF2141 family)